MKKIINFLVDKRIYVFGVFVVLTIISTLLINKVNINKDLTQYLPNDSKMNAGLEIINEEFPDSSISYQLKVMFEDLDESEKIPIQTELSSFGGVNRVDYEMNSADYNVDNYTLYKLDISLTEKEEIDLLIEDISASFKNYKLYTYYNNADIKVMNMIIPIAFALLLIILLLMTKSFFEPVILLASIGFSILLNMGTNIVFSSISDMTFSIAAVLQLVLSIDYSIILINRYYLEDEKLAGKDKILAMKNALYNSFKTITSSSITTFVGLLALLFMTFTIGADMGLVLAKGVFFSLLSVFTVLPCLILWSDKLLHKTNKNYLKMKRLQKKEAK